MSLNQLQKETQIIPKTMNTEISTKMNDCLSDSFESHVDPFFTSALQEDRYGRYRVWDKDDARSALATTKPIRRSDGNPDATD